MRMVGSPSLKLNQQPSRWQTSAMLPLSLTVLPWYLPAFAVTSASDTVLALVNAAPKCLPDDLTAQAGIANSAIIDKRLISGFFIFTSKNSLQIANRDYSLRERQKIKS